MLWYPTTAGEKRLERGPYILSGALDALPAKGKFPAVIISHGSGGTTLGHHTTAAFLVRAGWIVAIPLHVGSDSQDHSAEGTPRMWRGRPKQISAAIDAMLAETWLAPQIDRDRIAAIGFSAGGYSVLVAAGAIADMRRIAQHCKGHDDDPFCASAEGGASLATIEKPIVALKPDPRIRAAVVLAPIGVLFDDKAFAQVSIPIRLYRAERDEVLRHPYHAERVYRLLPRKAEYVVVPNAGHYAFTAPYPAQVSKEIGPPAENSPGFDRASFQARLNREIAEFLERVLPIEKF
jgi:predicted dienelactone hydrolase